ncbi:MAG: creatininase family protein [Promethearchaeota archaeon]
MPSWIKYEISLPYQLKEMISKPEYSIAYIPFGSLEWHGEHNVLGVDSLKARALLERVADKIGGGIMFPIQYWGACNLMPFPYSTGELDQDAVKQLVENTLDSMGKWGLRLIIILNGHYPDFLIKTLRKNCQRFNKNAIKRMEKYGHKYPCFAIGGPEMLFTHDKDYIGDHAAEWETSLMLYLYPELVDLDLAPKNLSGFDRAVKYGIMGKDPRIHASREKGEQMTNLIVERMVTLIQEVLKTNSNMPIKTCYDEFRKTMNKVYTIEGGKKYMDIQTDEELVEFGVWQLKGNKPQKEFKKFY